MPQTWCFSVFTWNLSLCGKTDARTARPASLHITGPSKCPRVDKPHPASIAGTRPGRPEVARRPGKVAVQVVWNCPCVAQWYNRQFTEDTLNWYDRESVSSGRTHIRWCDQAPNSCIVRYGPCAALNLSAPMCQAEHLPAQ